MIGGRVRAWTETILGQSGVRAAYVGVPPDSAPLTRAPAERMFASVDEARSWIENEARLLGLPIDWAEEKMHSTSS